MANKPWELTDKKISKIVSDNYDDDSWESSESAALSTQWAAQKKLLEYLSKTALSEEDMRSLLKEFGIGENND